MFSVSAGGASSAAPFFKAIPHVDGKHHNPSVLDVKEGRGRGGGGGERGGGAAGEKDSLFSHLRKT